MEYLNKIITTVATVKTNVNYALPGNVVAKEYEILSQCASAGPGLWWKIHDGLKKTTRKEVSVWIFEKKNLEMISSKIDRDALLDSLKVGVSRLTRLRHPMLLQVEHSLEESRDCIAFCTEPVLASLANVIGLRDNLPQNLPEHLSGYVLEKLEIQHGLLEIGEALKFLHVDAKILHRNICPESVIITKSLCWKLGGFDFCISGTSTGDQMPTYPLLEFNQRVTPCAQPPLNYFAPEYFTSGRCDAYSDIFSLGILIYAIFNNGRPLIEYKNNVENYKNNVTKLKSLSASFFAKIPENLAEDLKLTLHTTPELRPDALQITKLTYLVDENVKILHDLESMCQLDGPQKCQFLKTLNGQLDKFSHKILVRKILPFVAEQLKTAEIIPFIVPVLLYIGDKAEANEFSLLLMPILAPVFSMQTPYQIPMMLMQKMPMFLSKSPPNQIRDLVLPMMYASLDSNMSQLQEPCLAVLPNVVHLINSKLMKDHFLPKILNLASDVTTISVKINALISIGKMAEKLEKWMITDQILPTLSKVTSKEPAVLMAILGVFKICSASPKIGLTKEVCAKHCLPFLVSHSIENSLNLKQFDSFIFLIKEMLCKVEAEQRRKLQQFDGNVEQNSVILPLKSGIDIVENATTAANVAPADPQSNKRGAIGQKNPLTLEQKKKLAAEQDQATKSRLKQQAKILTPTRVDSTAGDAIRPSNSRNFDGSLLLPTLLPCAPPTKPPKSTGQSSGAGFVMPPKLDAPPPPSSNRIASTLSRSAASTEDWSMLLNSGSNSQTLAKESTNRQQTLRETPPTMRNDWSFNAANEKGNLLETTPLASDWTTPEPSTNRKAAPNLLKSSKTANGKSPFDDLVIFPAKAT